jgi:cell division protein FtsB
MSGKVPFPWKKRVPLTFKLLGSYLNFRAWFMKNVLFKQKNMKLQHKLYFVKKIRHYAACLKNAENFTVA